MVILQGLIGFMVLTMGSQLYWFFAGVIGFLTGIFAAEQVIQLQPGPNIILIGAGGAAIGVLLTITARKPAMVLVGFLAGALAANTLPELFGWTPGLMNGSCCSQARWWAGCLCCFLTPTRCSCFPAL